MVLRAEQQATSVTNELCVRRNNVSKTTYRGRSFRDQEAVREREREREGGREMRAEAARDRKECESEGKTDGERDKDDHICGGPVARGRKDAATLLTP